MKTEDPKSSIQVYADGFDFAEAKKFLSIKGNVRLQVIRDAMYPMWRYGQELVITREVPQNIEKGMAIVFWRDGLYHPCFVKEKLAEDKFTVFFLNGEQEMGEIEGKYLLGRIARPGLGLYWRLRLWYLLRS